MLKFYTTFFFSLILSGATLGQKEVREFDMPHQDTVFHMKQYFLVIYLSGPEQNQDSVTLANLQNSHINHIFAMSRAGVTCLSGPFGDDTEKRGILLFDVATREEAENWVKQDPMVKAGRLAYEIHPWWGAKGSFLK